MGGLIASLGMANVLTEEKKQQVLALGRLGWSLRRIQQETGVRRETAGTYLKAAGIAIRPPRGWGRQAPAKPAKQVITDSATAKPVNEVISDSGAIDSAEPDSRGRAVADCSPAPAPASLTERLSSWV